MPTPIDNRQETLAVNFSVDASGIYPARDFGGASTNLTLGMIRTYAFNFDVGFDTAGALLPITGNTALFSLMGTVYGGDGRTTFALPDLEDSVGVGQGTGSGLPPVSWGQSFGTTDVTLDESLIPGANGGGGQGFSEFQPSEAINYVINLAGNFPSRSGSGSTDHGFIGQVMPVAFNFDARGWAIADGRLLNIQDFPALFSILGTTYGGDGRITFALPDLQGRTPIGASNTFGETRLGQKVGEATETLTTNELPTGSALGATSAEIDNKQPSLGLNYIISLNGTYPSRTADAGDANTPFIGEISAFAGNFAPAGWAFAHGQLLPISGNEALYSLLGTQYGGDGRTTFALPDTRNRALTDNGGELNAGQTFGDNEYVLTQANIDGIVTNDDPTFDVTIPAIFEDRESAIPVVISDPDFEDGVGTMQFAFEFANGTVRIAPPAAGEDPLPPEVIIQGDGTSIIILTSPDIGLLNQVLQNLRVLPDPNTNSQNADHLIRLYANDGGSSGLGGGFTVVNTFDVSVTPIQDRVIARNDVVPVDEDGAISGTENVLGENGAGPDESPDDEELQVVAVQGFDFLVGEEIPLNSGSVIQIEKDGTLFYDPNGAFDFLPGPNSGASNTVLSDTFIYTINDANSTPSLADTAVVTVVVRGVDSDDILEGSSADDMLDGGVGEDIVAYAGTRSDYGVMFDTGIGKWVVTDNRGGSPDGTDTLTNIEQVQFADATVALAGGLDTAPGDDLYFQRSNGNHFIVNGATGAFSDGVGRGTDTVVDFDDVDDFTGDGIADTVFRRADSNYYVHDQTTEQVFGLGRGTETFVGTLDVEGDGAAEILFQRGNGNYYVVDITSTFVTGYGRSTEAILGIGDFDGDGGEDVLFERANGTFVWVDGATKAPSGLARDPSDQFIGIGDFDGNGIDDVLFARGSNGAKVAFNVDGSLLTAFGRVTQEVAAIGDFDGDGSDDVLFGVPTNDTFVTVDGATAGVIGTFTSPGSVVSVGDFVPDLADEVVIERLDGSYALVSPDGVDLVDYGQSGSTLIALDPLGTGSLDDVLIV